MQAQPEFGHLVESLLGSAQGLLASKGEFSPFACAATGEGELTEFEVAAEGTRPNNLDVFKFLVATLQASAPARGYVAAGICAEVRVVHPKTGERLEAACVFLEHKDGDAISVFLPFRRFRDGALEYGDVFAAREKPRIFQGAGGAGGA